MSKKSKSESLRSAINSSPSDEVVVAEIDASWELSYA
jgi:hypothetical protein